MIDQELATYRGGWLGQMGHRVKTALFFQIALLPLLRRLGADLLHCLQFVAPLRCPCPTVVTVHDLGYRHYPDTVEEPRRSYYRLLVPASLRGAAAVVCNSAATAADVRTTFPAVASRVTVTPFGVPSWTHEFTTPPAERAPDAPFLFVGTLEPRKNLSGLLLAYCSFLTECDAEKRRCPQLILVGSRGWKDSGLRDLLRPLVAADRVTVLDYCGPAQLWQQYGLACALLFPSLHEGFGFPILEAMVAGLPVMTSDRGAMAEVAGEAALLVDPLDQGALIAGMRRLTTDGDFCRELVTRGQRRWRLWSWDETARTTVETYRRVLNLSG